MTSPKDAIASQSGRFYVRDGRRFISVTNVLDHAISKPQLLGWAVKLTAEAALADLNSGRVASGQFKDTQRPRVTAAQKREGTAPYGPWDWKGQHTQVKNTSAEKGTLIHAWTEAWILGQQPDPPPGFEQEVAGVMRAFNRYGIEPLAAESTVYNDTYEYAGTADLFATVGAWGGALAVLDLKTGKRTYPETALQLAAYRYGEFIGLDNGEDVPVPAAERAGVLHVGRAETVLVPYKAGTTEFTVFLNALWLSRWLISDAEKAMGDPE